MRTMKFLMFAACLSSAAVITKTAMTQETPVIRQKAALPEPIGDPLYPSPATGTEPPTRYRNIPNEQPLDRLEDPKDSFLDPNSNVPHNTGPRQDLGDKPNVFSPSDVEVFRDDPVRSFMRPRRVTRTVIETFMEPIPQDELDASKKLQAAVQSLKTGKDEAARKAAADVIQQQLTTQFESDLKQREKELSEVEQRVKTLREQLDKRKAAKAEIINLRLQTLVNKANGLGFPGEDFRTDDLFAPQVPIAPRVDHRFESDPDRDGKFLTPVNPESNPTRPTDPSKGFNETEEEEVEESEENPRPTDPSKGFNGI